MALQHLALVSIVPAVGISELARVAAALQKQASRDLAPLWGVEATIDVFPEFEDIPIGYWPIVIVPDSPQPGLHKDINNQPIAYVLAGPTWSLAASHEVLEMLVDPWGNFLIAGDAPAPGTGRVEYLVEVSDPCQDAAFAYTVNGVLVSDFCTKAYFDPVGVTGVRYCYTGAIKAPHDVLTGGYLTWRVPETGHWIQHRNEAGNVTLRDLGPMSAGPLALRTMIDAMTPEKRGLSRVPETHPRVKAWATASANRAGAAKAQAAQWRETTQRVRGKS